MSQRHKHREENPIGPVKIVADGWLGKALAVRLDGVVLEEPVSQAGDRLVIYAHALFAGASHRTQHGGLRFLQELLANPESRPAAVAVLSLLPKDQLGSLQFLLEDPCVTFVHLLNETGAIEAASLLPMTLVPNAIWNRMAVECSEALLEQEASALRHSMAGLVATTRIYLGALMDGAADQSNAAGVLNQLSELARRQAGKGPAPDGSFLARLERHLKLRAQLSQAGEAGRKRLPPVILLDDEAREMGWDLVLPEICQEVRIAESAKELRHILRDGPQDNAVLLLDCKLAAGSSSGLAYLKTIRSITLELPVVMMTAFDDAELAIWALRAGANEFFAKQLLDISDRASLDYFRRFQEVLSRPPQERRIREAWRSFEQANLCEVKGEYAASSYDPAQARRFLELAFYALFSYLDGLAWWQWGVGKSSIKAAQAIGRLVVICLDNAFPQILKTLERPTPDLSAMHTAHATKIANARHGNPVSLDNALGMLEDLLQCLEPGATRRAIQRPALPPGCPYTEEDLKNDTVGRPVSHEDGHLRGSQELLEGARMLVVPHPGGGRLTMGTVLAVDDRGKDGWFEALHALWPDLLKFPTVPGAQDLQKAAVILLDLYLPDRKQGLKAVDRIKREYPELPVLVASASTEAPDALRCLRHGALAFVTKSLSFRRSPDQSESFALQLREHLEAACRIHSSKLGDSWKYYKQRYAVPGTLRSTPQRIQMRANALRKKREAKAEKQYQYIELPRDMNWEAAIRDALFLTILVHHNQQIRQIAGTRLPIPDQWRAERLLPRPSDTGSLIAFIASGVVERLAQWLHCLTSNDLLRNWDWGDGLIGSSMQKIGPAAKQLWDMRNKKSPNPDSVMALMVRAVEEYPGAIQALDTELLRSESDPANRQGQFDPDLNWDASQLRTELRKRWPCVVTDGKGGARYSSSLRVWGLEDGVARALVVYTTLAARQNNTAIGFDINHRLQQDRAWKKVAITVERSLPSNVNPRRFTPAAHLWEHVSKPSAVEEWARVAEYILSFAAQEGLTPFETAEQFNAAVR